MKIAHLASRVPLLAVAAVMLELWSLAADGRVDLRMSRADGGQGAVVDAQGSLPRPSNYRAAYEFLGAWAIAATRGVGSIELHNVFASPGTIARTTRVATSLMVYGADQRGLCDRDGPDDDGSVTLGR